MLRLEIVTPDKPFFDEDIEMVILTGIEGDLALMNNSAPITTPLKIGKVRIKKDGKERVASVTDGYVSMIDNKATVITEAAEWPDEIDFERAAAAKARAEERLKNRSDGIDVERAELALKRALNRLSLKK